MSRAKRAANGSNWWSSRHQFGFESGTLSDLFSFIKHKAVLCNQMKVLYKNKTIIMHIIALLYIITKL